MVEKYVGNTPLISNPNHDSGAGKRGKSEDPKRDIAGMRGKGSSLSPPHRPIHTVMLRTCSLTTLRPALLRTYATAAGPHALVLLEHRGGVIESSSLSALTAAEKLGGEVTGLVVGSPEEVQQVLPKAQKYVAAPF